MKSYIAPVMVGLMAYVGAGAPVNAEEPKRPAAYELRMQELESRRGTVLPQSTGSIDSRVQGVTGDGGDQPNLRETLNTYDHKKVDSLMSQSKYQEIIDYLMANGSNLGRILQLDDSQISKELSGAISIEYSEMMNNCGVAYKMIGQYENAARCYQAALVLNPKNETALSNVAYLFFKNIGDKTKARKYTQLLLALNPKNSKAKFLQKKLSL